MESLESILSDIQGKYKNPNASKQHKDEQIAENSPNQSSQSNNPPIAITPNSLDSLLNDLRSNSNTHTSDYSTQVTPEAIPNYVSSAIDRDLQQVANQQNTKNQDAIAKLAAEWLKKLDPLCGEGLWFEEFAKNYASRLEAAIAIFQSK
jgi:hypothetical protein